MNQLKLKYGETATISHVSNCVRRRHVYNNPIVASNIQHTFTRVLSSHIRRIKTYHRKNNQISKYSSIGLVVDVFTVR